MIIGVPDFWWASTSVIITTGALVLSGYAFPFSKTKLLDKEPTRSTGELGNLVASSSVRFLGVKCLAAECEVTTGNTSKLLGYLL